MCMLACSARMDQTLTLHLQLYISTLDIIVQRTKQCQITRFGSYLHFQILIKFHINLISDAAIYRKIPYLPRALLCNTFQVNHFQM